MINVPFKKLNPTAVVPEYMTDGAAGADLSACLDRPMIVEKGQRVRVPTGLSVEIPKGFEIQVRPRSGLAFKKGLTILNAPGTIDSDYRGEIQVILINLSEGVQTIEPGERIAQAVLNQVQQICFEEKTELSSTQRGEGGFGSTDSSARK